MLASIAGSKMFKNDVGLEAWGELSLNPDYICENALEDFDGTAPLKWEDRPIKEGNAAGRKIDDCDFNEDYWGTIKWFDGEPPFIDVPALKFSF